MPNHVPCLDSSICTIFLFVVLVCLPLQYIMLSQEPIPNAMNFPHLVSRYLTCMDQIHLSMCMYNRPKVTLDLRLWQWITPGNNHTHPKESHQKFSEGGGFKSQMFKMTLGRGHAEAQWPYGQGIHLRSKLSRLEPLLGTLCCGLGQDTLLSQCLSSPSIKEYWWTGGVTLQWPSIPSRGE